MLTLTRDQQLSAARLGVQFGTLLFNRGVTAGEAADKAGVSLGEVKDVMAGDACDVTVSTLKNLALVIGGTMSLEIKADEVKLGALMQALESVGAQIRPGLQASNSVPVPVATSFPPSRPAPAEPAAPTPPIEAGGADVGLQVESRKPSAMEILARAVTSSGISPI